MRGKSEGEGGGGAFQIQILSKSIHFLSDSNSLNDGKEGEHS